MISWFAQTYLAPLCLTIAIELGVGGLLGLRGRRALAVIVWMNILTNPVANLAMGLGIAAGWWVYGWGSMLPIEAAVVAAEWAILWQVLPTTQRRALWLSLALNGASGLASVLFC